MLQEMDLDPVMPDESADDGELLELMLLVVCMNSSCSDWTRGSG